MNLYHFAFYDWTIKKHHGSLLLGLSERHKNANLTKKKSLQPVMRNNILKLVRIIIHRRIKILTHFV